MKNKNEMNNWSIERGSSIRHQLVGGWWPLLSIINLAMNRLIIETYHVNRACGRKDGRRGRPPIEVRGGERSYFVHPRVQHEHIFINQNVSREKTSIVTSPLFLSFL